MSNEAREKVAELLKRKLDEISRRDGDLSARHPSPKRRPAAPASPPRTVPVQFGDSFEPAGRLSAVSASARPVTGESGLDPYVELDRWRMMYPGSGVADIVARAIGQAGFCARPDLLEVVRRLEVCVPVPTVEQATAALRSALWLVPGVRDRVSAALRDDGASAIGGLCAHPRFGRHATRIDRLIDRGDTARLLATVSDRGGAAHPLNLAVAAWFAPSDLLFVDIETGGLFGGSPVIVSGMAYAPRDGADGLEVRILVASTPDAEEELIAQTVQAIADHPVLVSFNGRSFDYPYICQRAAYYGAPVLSDPLHLDLLGFSRRVWRGGVTCCRLSVLAAEVLGMTRDHDIPGSLVPWFYEMYLRDPERNAGLLAAIAIHNFLDMEQTVRLYAEHVRLLTAAAAVPPEPEVLS